MKSESIYSYLKAYVYTDVDLFRHLINFDKQRD